MYSHSTPRTTQRVVGEDPNMGEQAAKAACMQQEFGGCCALAAITQGLKICIETQRLHDVHFLNVDFQKQICN